MKKKMKIDHIIFWPPLLFISIICGLIIKNPDKANEISNAALAWTTDKLGWSFEWYVIILFLIAMYFIFGKYKDKRFGDGEPEFKTSTWLGMIFTSTSSAALLYWATIEWYYYMQAPPFGAEPFSTEAAQWASAYGMYHWGLIPSAMYVVIGTAIGYNFFVKKRNVVKPSSVCGLLGKQKDGFTGKVIDILYIIGMVAGVGTSLGLGTPLVAELISKIFGIPHTLSMDGWILIAWIALFTTSIYFGLQKGIKILSDIRVYLAFGVIIFVAVFGPTSFILNGFTDALGTMLQNITRMTFYTDPYGKSGFPQGWTIFYWAWFLNCVVTYSIYLVKISKGRTVREFSLGVLGAIVLGEMVFFGVFTNYGMFAHYEGLVDIGTIMETAGPAAAIVGIYNTLPLAKIVLPVFLVYAFISTATFINGVAYTLAMVTTKEITEDDEPSRVNRIAWSLLLGVLAISLLMLGGLKPLQTASVLGGLPMMIVCIIIPLSFFKEVQKTGWKNSKKTKNDDEKRAG
ncbi:choline/carnitine/betaine transport [Schinkia azotoformans MEV2011]|uniref:L-carnitine/gamma-butyrobetaine antiporter n=2 Tax=Schinkia azotoformans TaxID=1454 RepID=K6C9Z5_SCHAZ|nr:L-carnitine/gamma-butyrobetaine antiporter [Schinkia azotoformans]EKN67950.1 L-carnitine/gamma-butyrobetaine antiporter [Schinkia azotoformans LMG 9581]KEF37828.1 choline/carnitine/betaine transport [Schinkia azotoformans MEV2011]MEC1637030.1 L-carnitine/gamma-butyrobetaine antiporter [Schinkia azotoformans]MEC1696510.1 L-carnitine/gamma-butyrobetaine antiporter [Schinkia azotoformans]MEC1716111.1 L-carnitine/gamma-butyrobetaine antiporter [Schinkia azotoformans]